MKRFCDRKDGTRVKKINGMNHIMYHLKSKRSDSEVYINQPIDVTEVIKYVDEINEKENKHITYFHVFSTAIGKTIYNRPYLNRFLINGYFYDRNEVLLSYVAKVKFNDDAQEVMHIIKVDKDDNLFTISDKISNVVKKARKDSQSSGADDLVANIGNMPKFIRGFVVGIFKFLDNHDLLPKSLTREILYYSSVIMSNIGSIGCKGAIHHNLTNFGTNSILITMGKIYKKEIINDDGKKEIRDFCDFGMTLDERIADGFYMIKSVNILEHILKNPKLLEDRCDEKVQV